MKKAYIFIVIAIVSLGIAIYHHYHQVAHKIVVNRKYKLSDFSKEDLNNFEKMLMNSEHGAQYFNKRWYRSGYEATFLDLDNHLIITNDVRGVKDTPTKILIFNVSGFIIIDKEKILTENEANLNAALNLGTLGIDQIEENERNILLQLRDQYISKK